MLIKRAIIIVGITVLVAATLFMVYAIIEKLISRSEIQVKTQSIPVAAVLFTLDSTRFVFPVAKPTVLVLFNSSCEHCGYELEQINERMYDFAGVEIVFVSSEPILAIRPIASLFGANNNVNFVKIDAESMYENFGTVRYPTILIYNRAGKLVKEFRGETKVEAILKYAH